MHIQQLIVDLAIMLSTAAVVTVVFKRLKLPLILGYILTGFLISPYFPMFLDVHSQDSISVLSEIGVTIILFHVGLEFDIKKLASIGSSAIVTALVKMSGVMLVGYLLGLILGFGTMDCVFLGAMLSISSTVVIQKCLQDQKLEKEKFATVVMGSLVVEDIVGVLLMVVLSTISASQTISGTDLAVKFAIMACTLVIWILLGIFILPTIFNKIHDHMTDEMLTVSSIGLCFLMALLASKLGFTAELGAFIAGSLIAGTNNAHHVVQVTSGIRDLFGAVFFMSVGMAVDPAIIAEYWTLILPIAIVAVFAKLIMGMVGAILSGQDLETATRAGAALAPIGEFSFIIAKLGINLGVIGEENYPLIVSASILTIIATPYLIKKSDSIVSLFERILPNRVLEKLDEYTSDDRDEEEKEQEWSYTTKSFLKKLFLYGSIMFADVIIGIKLLFPALLKLGMENSLAELISLIAIYAVIIIFIKPMLDFHSISFTHLWLDKKTNRLPLAALVLIKLAVLVFIAYIPLHYFYEIKAVLPVLIIAIIAVLISKTAVVQTLYLQVETHFLRNFNEKTIEETSLSILSFTVPQDATYRDKRLKELDWGRKYGVLLVKMRRGRKKKITPTGDSVIKVGDKLYIIGKEDALQAFHRANNLDEDEKIRTTEEFMSRDYEDSENELACASFRVTGREKYVDKPIKKSEIKEKAHCTVIGIRRDGYTSLLPEANMLINKDDILWVMGSNNDVGRLASHSIGQTGHHEHSHHRKERE